MFKKNLTVIFTAEELFKHVVLGKENEIRVSNHIPPEVLIEVIKVSDRDIKFVYFDYRELDEEWSAKYKKKVLHHLN